MLEPLLEPLYHFVPKYFIMFFLKTQTFSYITIIYYVNCPNLGTIYTFMYLYLFLPAQDTIKATCYIYLSHIL